MAQPQKRTSLRHLREHLVCVLCGGYLIDATTIVECLHSFCKTCIVRYLDSSKFCPICDVQVHKTKPLVNIRMDHTLQDMVYKLVPGLFKEEMKRRREFYKENVDEDDHTGPWPEYYIDDDGEVQRERVIFSNDEQISLSLQLSTDGKPPKTSDKMDYEGSTEITDCRYLLCPAAVTVSHLKKFIRLKFNLCDRYQIDVYHTDEILQDHYTLMDIAYIYIWRRKGPLRLFYTVYANPAKRLKRSASSTVTSDVTKDTNIVEMTCNNKVSGPPDRSEKQISSTVQKTTKIDDNLPKIDTKKSECLPSSNVTSSSNCDGFVSSNLESVQKADKKSLQTTQDSKHNIDSNHKPYTPKRKDGISCTSINVPTPHRSFLLGPKPKEKSDKKQKDYFTSTKPRDQILSLPVKHPGGKHSVPQNKPLEHNSKSFPAPKLSNASHTQHNGKPSNQSNSSDDVKITNNNNTTITSSISPAINSSGDKHTGSKNSIVSDGCVPSDARKQKLKHDVTNKTAIIKNGGDNNVTKSSSHAYINKPGVSHGGSTLSSADKTRKLLHIPERPIHAYVPMAHYQGMNGLFHYRAHMQDYGNDAPQDLSMKKKTKEITESNGKPAKPVNDTDNKKPKENESDKNGEVDRYAFTDEDASPVTSRKLQHVKSEPLTLS